MKGERVRGEGDPGKAQLGDGQREGETGELLIGRGRVCALANAFNFMK